ncbi:hypothetical protein [Xylanimonas protaetiae]|uniref:DUF308 domain-containing protein n=1 Tax=Xylanimonas protaetiae TaxID=2509457 RepID=A0A4P6FAJ7_9MICO|nr:hypothetical protein [Xylanimonas protaetiae]QAY71309.1 hypothetical protein ET471_15780 [Xylanimonas protaetiae]
MAGTSTGGGVGRDDDAQSDNAQSDDARDARDDAGARHDGEGDQLGDADVEARWADIVAQLGELDGAAPADTPDKAGPPAPTGHVVARAPGPRDWPATPDVEALEDAESHFTPPDPGPVVTGRDPLSTLAWACAVGIPLLAVVALVVRSFVPVHAPGWVGPAAVVVFLASVGVLVWRMPQRRDPDDHGNGAVV